MELVKGKKTSEVGDPNLGGLTKQGFLDKLSIMIITWHGEGAVKIQDKEAVVAINPHNGATGKMPSFAAELALVGHEGATLDPIRENPLVIKNPGEYESKGVFVYGIATGAGEESSIFVLEIEGVQIGYLGGFAKDALNEEQVEKLEGVDILLIPVGGKDVLSARQAIKIINQIEPRIVIPIEYTTTGYKGPRDGVEPFLKEFGAMKAERADKLKIIKKDLPQDETKVIVLTPS